MAKRCNFPLQVENISLPSILIANFNQNRFFSTDFSALKGDENISLPSHSPFKYIFNFY